MVGANLPRTAPVTLLQLAVLAVVQGVTEFLPISSSGHLVLVPAVTGWPDQGLVIDVAVHVGTLAAVIVHLRSDLLGMLRGAAAGEPAAGRRLLGQAALATVPVMIAGGLVFLHAGPGCRSVAVIGWTTLVFGVLLYAADRLMPAASRLEDLTWGKALLIGVAQILALVPGTSRAGITMTAGRFLGLERVEAARFSMMLAVPAIAAAGAAAVWKLADSGSIPLLGEAAAAAAIAFAAALVAIRLMMGWLRRASFAPFAVYRVFLGAALLGWVYL